MTRHGLYKYCDRDCEAQPNCTVCGKRKPPRGRDVPAAMAGSYCEHECPGQNQEPRAGHLWPGELDEMDREDA